MHGRVDALAPPKIPSEKGDLRLGVAPVAGKHAHVLAGLDQPGDDRSSKAAGATRDKNW
jgi:hypothetical protein